MLPPAAWLNGAFAAAWDLVLAGCMGHYSTTSQIVRRRAELRPTDVMLDVGGGTGGASAPLRDQVRTVVVLEPSAALTAHGARRYKACSFLRGDARRLPARDASVDVVLLVELLHHVDDAEAVLRETRRVLRPGGRVLIEESEFGGVGGRVRRWLEERISPGVWPRDRATLDGQLRALGFSATFLEQDGFVVLARDARGAPVEPEAAGSVQRAAP